MDTCDVDDDAGIPDVERSWSSSFAVGAKAWRAGASALDNPYEGGAAAQGWHDGWATAHTSSTPALRSRCTEDVILPPQYTEEDDGSGHPD